MNIEISCSVCESNLFDNLNKQTSFQVYSRLFPICDDGVYEWKCPLGHDSMTILSIPKHELLFDSAFNALLDGYFREAISSFAAALERFYEFAIRVICQSKSISQEDFEIYWKPISKRSEQQIGAFTMLLCN